MANKIQICNIAISRIGARTIQSLSDNAKEARECDRHYDFARDAVLADHDWGFARKRLTLSLLTDTFSGWQYAYVYPTDCIKARKIYDGTGAYTGTSYDIDSDRVVQIGNVEYEIASSEDKDYRMILTDKESAELFYTARITDANLYSPQFISALGFRLAAELAVPIRSDSKLAQLMLDSYVRELGRARMIDANEDYKKPDEINSFVEARS